MRLFWSPRSPFARKAMVVAHEVGVANRIEQVTTIVTAETFNADYASINPTGLLPALELEDGHVLFDSDVICEYLDTVFGGEHLLPRPLAARFQVLKRQSLGNGLMDRAVRWLGENFRPPALKSDDVIRSCRQSIQAMLDSLEIDATAAGDKRFDMGDATVACALSYLDFRFAAERWRDGRPCLATRYAAQALRPSLRETEYIAAKPSI
ncbi:glutathione S-transferase family protein [Microvirga alba]|uniref:Glutathione S-transferase N-terminal domain-containing protein n=1 Tax=Microvirga alba TaxID=2791025 RepID=A0A931BU50_9HYPH|nr:glutathione S-transferase N-terminal domain-containing protein [Microvirga alba]MBF9233860.1 glutathione S-transferase N-terminal domain-containing protein [Microvirga alba]